MSDPSEPQSEESRRVPLLLWAMIGVIVVGLVALWLTFGADRRSVSRSTTVPMVEPQKAPETSRPVQR